jgi:hypothetical protein
MTGLRAAAKAQACSILKPGCVFVLIDLMLNT